MLTETAHPQPQPHPLSDDDSGSEPDLSALAEHLSVIADALRKTTGSTAADQTKGHAQAQIERLANNAVNLGPLDIAAGPQGEAPVYLNSASVSHGSTTAAPAIHPDAKTRRRHFGVMAREAYAVRRRRTHIFDNDELFGEPAWDILLDLYIAHVECKTVSVSSACIGSAAPPTTGLRWLGVLSEQRLVSREHDPEDQRRVLVRLTDKGLAAMDEYFEGLGLSA